MAAQLLLRARLPLALAAGLATVAASPSALGLGARSESARPASQKPQASESEPSKPKLKARPSFSERAVGNYENRLRKFSAPERVFEYFSSVEIDRRAFMTRADLARAITPYTYRPGAPLASKNPKFNAKARTDKTTKA